MGLGLAGGVEGGVTIQRGGFAEAELAGKSELPIGRGPRACEAEHQVELGGRGCA